MDKASARYVLEVATQCSNQLSALVPYLKSNCIDASEYENLSKHIATTIACVYYEVKNPLYDMFPELRDEIEAKLKLADMRNSD